jgi:hypothetical protein
LFATRERKAKRSHELDLLHEQLGLQRHLTPASTPRTNSVVEHFNCHIVNVPKTHRPNSAEGLEQTPLHYLALYNLQLLQSALQSKMPMLPYQAMALNAALTVQ